MARSYITCSEKLIYVISDESEHCSLKVNFQTTQHAVPHSPYTATTQGNVKPCSMSVGIEFNCKHDQLKELVQLNLTLVMSNFTSPGTGMRKACLSGERLNFPSAVSPPQLHSDFDKALVTSQSYKYWTKRSRAGCWQLSTLHCALTCSIITSYTCNQVVICKLTSAFLATFLSLVCGRRHVADKYHLLTLSQHLKHHFHFSLLEACATLDLLCTASATNRQSHVASSVVAELQGK